MSKHRFAFVGTGGRAISFIEPLATTYRDTNELVGLCDLSAARMAYYNALLAGELGYHAVPAYPADRFDAMLRETRPDTVFVCSKDSTHHDYIIRSMRAGCDVITEKPLTIDAEKCRAILDAQRETGRRWIGRHHEIQLDQQHPNGRVCAGGAPSQAFRCQDFESGTC